MTLIEAPTYHAHVYFQPDELAAATRLHAAAGQALGAMATVWPLRDRPVGPHTAPMFEIEFPHASREAVLGWVETHHGPFSVLLHPETGNELADHRDRAIWLGTPLPLKLERLS